MEGGGSIRQSIFMGGWMGTMSTVLLVCCCVEGCNQTDNNIMVHTRTHTPTGEKLQHFCCELLKRKRH